MQGNINNKRTYRVQLDVLLCGFLRCSLKLNSDFRWVLCTLFYMAVFVGWNQNFNIVKDNVRWFIETWPSVNSRTNTREFTYMYDHLSSMYKKNLISVEGQMKAFHYLSLLPFLLRIRFLFLATFIFIPVFLPTLEAFMLLFYMYPFTLPWIGVFVCCSCF